MKKDTKVIRVDRNMVHLMTDQLYRNLGSGAAEVCRTLEGLLDGSYESVVLQLGDVPHVLQDACIVCGELSIHLQTRKVTRGGEHPQGI